MNMKLLIVFLAIIIIIVFLYKNNIENIDNVASENNVPIEGEYSENNEDSGDNEEESKVKKVRKKVLNYYASPNCPHSREGSSMYNLINKKFKNIYTDVKINIIWDNEKGELFDKNNIIYVPTITSKLNKHLTIGLPDGIIKEGKTDNELEEILLKNIYNQL